MKIYLFLLLTLSIPAWGEPNILDTAVVVGYSKTWEALPAPASRGSVRDSRGNIYVAYADSEGIFVKRSTNQGQTWTLLDTLVYPAPFTEIAYPAVAILAGDTLFVAWEEGYLDTNSVWRYDIFVCRYDGTVWTSPEAISYTAPGGNSAHNPCLAPSPGGRIYCVWQSQNRGVWYAGYQAGVWSPPENIAPGGLVTYPTLVADSLDDLYLGFIYNGISYKKRTGGVWGLTETVNSFGTGPCIAVDRSFRPHIVYTVRLDSFNFDIYYQFRKEGSGWSFPYNISNNISESKGPNISVDVNDHLYVAWQDDERDTTIGHSDIFYSNYDTLWARPVAITDSNSPPHGSVTLGYPVTSEGVDVVWARGLAYKREQILYRRLPPLGSGVEVGGQSRLNVEDFKLTVSSPARSVLRVGYTLPAQSWVSLVLYDISGRKVAFLEDVDKPAGRYEVKRPLTHLPSGVYFLRLEAGKEALTRKLIVLR